VRVVVVVSAVVAQPVIRTVASARKVKAIRFFFIAINTDRTGFVDGLNKKIAQLALAISQTIAVSIC